MVILIVFFLLGRYIYHRPNLNGDPYKTDFELNSIDLGTAGIYEITYMVVLGCEDDEACALTGDNIKVIINDDKSDRVEDVINYDNVGFQKRWMPRSITLNASDPKISVINPTFIFSNSHSLYIV